MTFNLLRHVSGQTFASIVQFMIGIIFIRLLPVEQYGLYILSASIQVVVCCMSDLGLASGVNTFVARSDQSRKKIGEVLLVSWRLQKRFNLIAVIVGIITGYLILTPSIPYFSHIIPLIGISIIAGMFQGKSNILKSTLNALQDGPALLKLAIVEIIPRLFLLPIVVVFPHALVAVILNLFSVILGWIVVAKFVSRRMLVIDTCSSSVYRDLSSFVYRLIPSVTYSALQGHVGIFLLGIAGSTQIIAETGALSRLGQIFGLLLVLNPFWIQPYFARLDKKKVRSKIILLIIILVAVQSVFILSSIFLPEIWSWILGKKYANTSDVVFLAVAGACFYLGSSFLYTVLLARGITYGQTQSILVSMCLQVFMIFFIGIDSTVSALILGIIPGLVSFLVQSILVFSIILNIRNVLRRIEVR